MKILLENLKQKRLIVFKVVLLTAISASAGYDFYAHLFVSIDNANFWSSLCKLVSCWGDPDTERIKTIEYFVKGIPYYFSLYIFVALSQWALFSEKLPSKWLYACLLGASVAGLLESASRQLIFIPQYPLMELQVDFLNGCLVTGFLGAVPQWLLLSKKQRVNNFYWLIINSVGWGVAGLFLRQELAISYIFGFGKVNVAIFDLIRYYRLWYIVDFCSFIPLGIGTGLFLAQLETKEYAKA